MDSGAASHTKQVPRGDEPDHQPRDGPFEVHGALVAGSVLLQA